MNATALNLVGRSYLAVLDRRQQSVVSSLNFGGAGVVVGTEVASSGTVCMFVSEETHLTLDVVGSIES